MTKTLLRATFLIKVLLFLSISVSFAQTSSVTLSGIVKDKNDKSALPYVNVVLKTEKDSVLVTGTVTDEEGRFTLTGIKPNNYFLEISYIGYTTKKQTLFVGTLSEFLNVATIELEEETKTLNEVVITAKTDDVSVIIVTGKQIGRAHV